VHVYTGDGKGKTTAAFGLSLRAAGAGLSVFICQFLKKGIFSEIKSLKVFSKNIKVEQFGSGCFIRRKPVKRDINIARKGFQKTKEIITNGKYDVVVLDELNSAMALKLIDVEDVINLLKNKPAHVDVIITGRNAPKKLISCADLVTEMKDRKHYYRCGVKARKGIEY